MTTESVDAYAARLNVDYPDRPLDRVSTGLRLFYIVPIVILLSAMGGGVLFFPILLMIVFRQKYPRWWFDFSRELLRFETRVGAYFALMSDEYPSTDEEQYVHLEVDYPDVEDDLNRWLPLVKWLLAIPHFIVLMFLAIAAFFVLIIAWFAILFTGKYPRELFRFVEGVMRWSIRVQAYVGLMVTDRYPPFSLS